SITDLLLVSNGAKYTVKNGANRVGGSNITVNGDGVPDTMNVVTWDTTAGQDPKFAMMTVNSSNYNRQHSCMMAEALVPNDPNRANNTRQVNMDFVCVPGEAGGGEYMFSMGWAGFGKYDPGTGKDLFIQAT